MIARFLGNYRAGPAHREFLRLVFLVVRGRRAGAELEINVSIRALERVLVPAVVAAVVVAGLETPRLPDLRPAGETADQVGDGVEELPVGEAGQLDARRVVPGLGSGRIKRIEDISCDEFSVVADALFRVILRHGAGDDVGQFFDRPIADEWFVVFIGHALSLVAVALGALVRVD